jgi:hypothetical protein
MQLRLLQLLRFSYDQLSPGAQLLLLDLVVFWRPTHAVASLVEAKSWCCAARGNASYGAADVDMWVRGLLHCHLK